MKLIFLLMATFFTTQVFAENPEVVAPIGVKTVNPGQPNEDIPEPEATTGNNGGAGGCTIPLSKEDETEGMFSDSELNTKSIQKQFAFHFGGKERYAIPLGSKCGKDILSQDGKTSCKICRSNFKAGSANQALIVAQTHTSSGAEPMKNVSHSTRSPDGTSESMSSNSLTGLRIKLANKDNKNELNMECTSANGNPLQNGRQFFRDLGKMFKSSSVKCPKEVQKRNGPQAPGGTTAT